MTPTAEIGPANQAAGKVKTLDASDFSAKIWIVFGEKELLLAADVTDDAVLAPTSPSGVINRDHAELWIAFPAAEVPPIGFSHIRLGDFEIPNSEWCETEELVTDPDSCSEWFQQQLDWHRALSRLFIRQYLISAIGIQEAYFVKAPAASRPEEMPFAWPDCCKNSRSKVVQRPGGYSVEAAIGLADLPPTARDPLAEFRMTIDFADRDVPESLDSFFSTSSKRKFGDVSTFNRARLTSPRLFESQTPFVASILNGKQPLFVFPAASVDGIYGLENCMQGYEDIPSGGSPEIVKMKIPVRPVAQAFGMDLYLAPLEMNPYCGTRSRLLAVRDRKTVADHEIQGACDDNELEAVKEKDLGTCRLLVFICSGLHNPVGFGMCGACPMVSFDVVAIDSSGRMRSMEKEAQYLECEGGLDIESLPDNDSYFGFRCVTDETDIETTGPTEWKFEWSSYKDACRK